MNDGDDQKSDTIQKVSDFEYDKGQDLKDDEEYSDAFDDDFQ